MALPGAVTNAGRQAGLDVLSAPGRHVPPVRWRAGVRADQRRRGLLAAESRQQGHLGLCQRLRRDGLRQPDPYTVTVTLDKPLSTALFYPRVANYSGGYIVCKKAAEKLGPDGLKTHPVGTGPFMFKSYSPKEKMDLVANDAYFRGKPQLDGIEYRYMADLSSRELGLRERTARRDLRPGTTASGSTRCRARRTSRSTCLA